MNDGKHGEYLVKDFLQRHEYVIMDVSADPTYWCQDIDIIAFNPRTGSSASIEVKTDDYIHKTHNLFLELSNPRSKEGKGWFKFCKADWLYYIDNVTKDCYIFSMPELRQATESTPLRVTFTADGVVGILFPLSQLSNYKVVNLND